MRITEEQYNQLKGRRALAKAKKRPIPKPAMNKTEARYRQQLELQRHAGEIINFWFEPSKWKVSPDFNGTYTPDFLVLRSDHSLLFVEVKGKYIREDALAKFKAAAGMYPCLAWKMMQWTGSVWRMVHYYEVCR